MDQQGADSNFSAAAQADGDHVTVNVTGEVDMATADTMYAAATPSGAARLTLDLRAVTFFDSAAIHALVRLGALYADALTVLPSPQVRRVLDISGLGDQPWLAD
ncbi:STAS domain-containing protein [Polymorphospora lycopeni]|uniref:STAS domain-containing protein n=1 Tax=Polymorphospora lycopeni TaxID=3140240 RepID=A0ABV5CQJ4_9ACTN